MIEIGTLRSKDTNVTSRLSYEGLDLSLKFQKSRFVERDIRFCEENAFLDSGCLRAKVPDSVCKESRKGKSVQEEKT